MHEQQPETSKRALTTELDKEKQQLKKSNPEVLFVGNSMVFTRIDRREIQKLSGRKNTFLTNSGAASACWYLFLKNIIVPSEVRPELTIFFFRDQMLTWPEFRTRSYFVNYLNSLRLPDDTLIDQILNAPKPGTNHLSQTIDRIYGINAQPDDYQEKLRDFAMDITPFGADKQPRRLYVNGRFSLDNLRHDLAADDIIQRREDEPPLYFDPSPEASFLPHILKIARENKLPICFYRVKKTMDVDGTRPPSPYLEKYLTDLRQYIESNGAIFIDETKDEIPEAWYADGDHIAKDQRTIYTNFFWSKIKPLLPITNNQ
jgi:hypothetical protein